MVMNLPSLEKFAPKVRPGGVIVVNDLAHRQGRQPRGLHGHQDPGPRDGPGGGNGSGRQLRDAGPYVGATGVVPAEVVEAEIENEFTGRKAKFAPANIAAFRAGLAEGQKVHVTA